MIAMFVFGTVTGFVLGYFFRMVLKELPPSEKEMTLKESIEVCRNLSNNEPFISIEQTIAIDNLIQYAESQMLNDDDLK